MATAFTAKIVRTWVAGLVARTRAQRPPVAAPLGAAALRARAAAIAASAAEAHGGAARPRVRGFAPLVVVDGGRG
jgi:hypothetical protein